MLIAKIAHLIYYLQLFSSLYDETRPNFQNLWKSIGGRTLIDPSPRFKVLQFTLGFVVAIILLKSLW